MTDGLDGSAMTSPGLVGAPRRPRGGGLLSMRGVSVHDAVANLVPLYRSASLCLGRRRPPPAAAVD